ncbi:MAG: 4Fe-4S binding protein [Candidatus Aenigmarchaeota archaeon]|nr:4Fe-4S binding protein [Candidatus Aenigmarchaeota archaeon]
MVKRKIIEIDEDKCNGCGQCIPNCPEGALQIIDNKARLVSDLFCDGLGACIGHCPQGAIKTIEREAEPYNERKVMEIIVKQGINTIKAHLEHLEEHGEEGFLNEALKFLKEKGIEVKRDEPKKKSVPCACPGSDVKDLRDTEKKPSGPVGRQQSELKQWPVQLMLIPTNASYLQGTDLLIAADCVPFAYANFHQDFIKDKTVIMGCPKLDDTEFYAEKLAEIMKHNDIKSITLAVMEVPCCSGLLRLIENAMEESGKVIPIKKYVIKIDGSKQEF